MSPIPFALLQDELLRIYSTGKHALKTFYRLNQVLGELAALRREPEGTPVVQTTADLTTATMAAYVSWLGPEANPNTVNTSLDYARVACSYAVEEGHLARSPSWKRVRPRARKATLNPCLSVDQLRDLLALLKARSVDWTGRRLYTLTSLIAMTGLRRNEALYLRAEDVDLLARTLDVGRAVRTKTEASEGEVPIPEAAAAVLSEWLPEIAGTPWLFPGVRLQGPWTGGEPGRRAIDQLKAAAKDAGIAKVTWHGLRHSYATAALVHFGKPLWAVQHSMRHRDLRTTQGYLHLERSPALAESVRDIAYL